jgi:DNA-binding beta-propeller fold protein YncE
MAWATTLSLRLTPGERMGPVRLVSDPELSPLDLAIAPNGNLVVSSEHPFGASGAAMTVREYDAADGHLVRVFSPSAELRRPRGLRFGPDGHLYCVAQDEVVARSITIAADVWGPQCDFPDCTAKRWCSFLKRQ